MKYLSTRGGAPIAEFEDVLLAGLAPDGGLYMPAQWPRFEPSEITAFRGAPYADVAAAVISRFTGAAFSKQRLLDLAQQAYAGFDHVEIAPLTQDAEDDWILELFHGPTLAFKDFAMQIIGRMFDDVLSRHDQRLTIIVATSGDTGAAAIEALRRCNHVDIVVLHPEGRVTDVQRRMMTTVEAPNVHNIAVAGSFDDCQAIVKELFADERFAKSVSLGGVNSINWARLAAQAAYYFTAAAALPETSDPVNFVVPTGNFGDVFSGYAAKKMGLPVSKLVVATNKNDILHRALATGDYTPSKVAPTMSPSMDIQVASNFERLLFEVKDRDSDALGETMRDFESGGQILLSAEERSIIAADFLSYSVSEENTLGEIKQHYAKTGKLIDPHTAVGRRAARALRGDGKIDGVTVTLATAHPAKFPGAIKAAAGVHPALPSRFSSLFDRHERVIKSAASTLDIKKVITERVQGKIHQ